MNFIFLMRNHAACRIMFCCICFTFQKKYVMDVVKIAYSTQRVAVADEGADASSGKKKKKRKSNLSPQGLAWEALIDLQYMPAVMTADYTKPEVKKLGLGQSSWKQKDAIYQENGLTYIVALVSS